MKKVIVVSKTHLDLGFTDFASRIKRKYIEEYIPGAISLAEQLNQNGSKKIHMDHRLMDSERGAFKGRLYAAGTPEKSYCAGKHCAACHAVYNAHGTAGQRHA